MSINKRFRYFIGLAILLSFQLEGESQEVLFPSLTGEALIQKIVEAYKPSVVLSYGDARDEMYGTIDNSNDSVTCVYSGHRIFLPSGVDPTAFLYMSGSNNGINAEHTYPRSKGADSGNPLSDMHHLFPTRAAVNAGRGNSPFGEINDNQTTRWYYLNGDQSSIPNDNIDLYSEEVNGRFEPQENHKGNAARAVFYFFSMYEEEALDADPNFFDGQKQTLCDWHQNDPVDEKELARTYMIAEHQDDLPNPYVIDPTSADRAFCGAAPTSLSETSRSDISIYPNPVHDRLQIIFEGKSSVQVSDVLGKVLVNATFRNFTEVDFSTFARGIYFVVVDGEVFRVFKK